MLSILPSVYWSFRGAYKTSMRSFFASGTFSSQGVLLDRYCVHARIGETCHAEPYDYFQLPFVMPNPQSFITHTHLPSSMNIEGQHSHFKARRRAKRQIEGVFRAFCSSKTRCSSEREFGTRQNCYLPIPTASTCLVCPTP